MLDYLLDTEMDTRILVTACDPDEGALVIERRNVIVDEIEYLMKIDALIAKHRNNYKIIIFDAAGHESSSLTSKNIIHIKINSEKHWRFLLVEMIQYAYLFKFALYTYLSK
jgi:hypothetical protein